MKINFANVVKAIIGVGTVGVGMTAALKGLNNAYIAAKEGFTKSDDEITVDNAEVIEEESEDDVVED